jgi:hypothetical protein
VSFAQLLGYAGIIVGICASLAIGFAWGRGMMMKHTNEMLRAAVEEERAERVEVERRCSQRITELENRIAVLTERLG